MLNLQTCVKKMALSRFIKNTCLEFNSRLMIIKTAIATSGSGICFRRFENTCLQLEMIIVLIFEDGSNGLR